MNLQSLLSVVGLVAILVLWLLASRIGNLIGVMPKKWQSWMLGETRNGQRSKSDAVIM